MTFNPGRNVGRLSIRVIPDTTRFRKSLKAALEQIERKTSMAVNVNKANLDKAKIREDIRRQVEGLGGVAVDVTARVNVDKARLKKAALRKSIQDQFDKFDDVRVKISAEISNAERFEKEVRDMVNRASRNKVKISASATTAAASAQLAWVSRDRFVNLVVRVSKASTVAALTSLAALSGARLSWKWIDNLLTFAKDLDKTLPSLLGWTTGITSLAAAVAGSVSGLVGVGSGLVSILPALLAVPGLFLNMLGSVTALVVALRNVKTELAPLKDDMYELGDIINEAFWGAAREPIIDLVDSLMPQLRNSFRDLSTGIGEFTAAMSRAFGEELAGGRLESIFRGIAEGWEVLGTGASGFAGALVSLSNVAATYTPRLAGWFVRQANTFDTWLKAISEDGRLGDWMEQSIDSMYDLWGATKGVAGVFTGIWKAAEAAGSGGLKGFAQLMLRWREVVNSADFQRGLTAIFRGSAEAMSSFGDAIKAVGRLVSSLDSSFEKFIASAGAFLGGIIEGGANALNQADVALGMNDFSNGLLRALDGILPYLPTLGSTFGGFLGLLGDLAATALPAAASVLAALMPSLDALVDAIRPILPDLANAVTSFAESVGPALTDFVKAALPVMTDLVSLFGELLQDLGPLLSDILKMITNVINFILSQMGYDPQVVQNQAEFEASGKAPNRDDFSSYEEYWDAYLKAAQEYMDDKFIISPKLKMEEWDTDRIREEVTAIYEAFKSGGTEAAQKLWDSFAAEAPSSARASVQEMLELFRVDLQWSAQNQVSTWVDALRSQLDSGGQEAMQAMWDQMVSPLPSDVQAQILENLGSWGEGLETELGEIGGGFGGGFSRGLSDGMLGLLPELQGTGQKIKDSVRGSVQDASSWLIESGVGVVSGLKSGAETKLTEVPTVFSGLHGTLLGIFAGAGSWLTSVGENLASGIASGMLRRGRDVESAAQSVVSSAVVAGKRYAEIHSPSRLLAREIGEPLGAGVAMGIDKSAKGVQASMSNAINFDGISGDGTFPAGTTLYQENHFEHADPYIAVGLARQAAQFELRG